MVHGRWAVPFLSSQPLNGLGGPDMRQKRSKKITNIAIDIQHSSSHNHGSRKKWDIYLQYQFPWNLKGSFPTTKPWWNEIGACSHSDTAKMHKGQSDTGIPHEEATLACAFETGPNVFRPNKLILKPPKVWI